MTFLRILKRSNQKNSLKHTLYFYICCIIYRILLDYNYINIISPFNQYDNFNIYKSNELISWVIFSIFIFFGYIFIKNGPKFLNILVVFLLFFKLIPFTSYLECAPIPEELIILESMYFITMLLCFKYIPALRLPKPHSHPLLINIIAISLISVIFFISAIYAHFRIQLNLADVYELREEARSYGTPTILNYLHSAASKILPLFLIYYLENKKKLMVYIIIISLLLSFGSNGLKATFFNLIICLLLYSLRRYKIFNNIPQLFLLLMFFATLEFYLMNSFLINQFLIRRMLYMPSLLDEYYFKYVKFHSPIFFDSNIDGIAIEYVVGSLWRDISCYANNGLFSDAYINLGFIGIILYPIMYALFFKNIGRIIDYKPIYIRFFAAFITVNVFVSSFFTIGLITHGLLLMFIVISIMPNISKKHFDTKYSHLST